MDRPDDRVDGESHHKPAELLLRKVPKIHGCSWPGEPAGFDPFVQQKKSVSLPEETFDLGGGVSTEQKQCVGNKKIHLVALLDNGGKGIDTVTHVGISADKVDSGKRSKVSVFKHGAPP